MPKTKKTTDSYIDRIESEVKSNQSTLSLVLGALIIVVVGVLIFNYFNKQKTPEVGPAQETEQGDVNPENLPGKYTVKEGDTLFIIAEKYYKDGFKYPEIVKANDLKDENSIEVGQVLEIPKSEAEIIPTESPAPTEEVSTTPTPETTITIVPTEEKGAEVKMGPSDTQWGTAIKDNTYTVMEGDWLSTIAARAYGDVMAYQKIAEANNITNPNLITPGTVLKIPR